MFSYNIEPLRNESQALIWGKVLVFDEKQEKYDPSTSQMQTACVLVNGIERQFYVLVKDEVGISRIPADYRINDLFM